MVVIAIVSPVIAPLAVMKAFLAQTVKDSVAVKIRVNVINLMALVTARADFLEINVVKSVIAKVMHSVTRKVYAPLNVNTDTLDQLAKVNANVRMAIARRQMDLAIVMMGITARNANIKLSVKNPKTGGYILGTVTTVKYLSTRHVRWKLSVNRNIKIHLILCGTSLAM